METYQKERCVYSVICDRLVSDEGVTYEAYGIKAQLLADIVEISDVTTEREEIDALVDMCNREELDIIHIYDVVEDFLAR